MLYTLMPGAIYVIIVAARASWYRMTREVGSRGSIGDWSVCIDTISQSQRSDRYVNIITYPGYTTSVV